MTARTFSIPQPPDGLTKIADCDEEIWIRRIHADVPAGESEWEHALTGRVEFWNHILAEYGPVNAVVEPIQVPAERLNVEALAMEIGNELNLRGYSRIPAGDVAERVVRFLTAPEGESE